MADSSELLKQITQERDAGALSKLYDLHGPGLFALARRILKNDTEAEDVIQEIFIYVWNQSRLFDPARGNASQWLSLLTRSRSIDRLRRRRSRQSHEVGFIAPSEEEPLAAWEPAGPDPEPLDELRRKEETERVLKTLVQLPEEQRKVIELAYYEGLSQSEIAERLAEPLGTVKTRMRLGMMKLSAGLQEYARGTS